MHSEQQYIKLTMSEIEKGEISDPVSLAERENCV